MFEDKCVEARMIQFRRLLNKFEKNDSSRIIFYDPCNTDTTAYTLVDQDTLKFASLRLAHQCRMHTKKHGLHLNSKINITE
jgi:hypothetical protein